MVTDLISLEQMLSDLKLATNEPSARLQKHLDYTVKLARPYDGSWKAYWLLNNWHAPIWKTSIGAKTRKNTQGDWIGINKVNWDIMLPDGHRLTDDRYSTLLETARRSSFLFRNGLATSDPPSITTWIKFNYFLLKLCSWLVLEKSRYHPAEFGFKLLDQSGIQRLLIAIAQGGWCKANSLIERCMSSLYTAVFKQPIPQALLDTPMSWPETTRIKVIDWLDANHGFTLRHGKSTGTISRAFLAKMINASTEGLSAHSRLDAALRQFEPLHAHPSLLISTCQSTEYPTQSTPFLAQEQNQPSAKGTVKVAVKALSPLLMLYRHMQNRLPSPTGINLPKASADAYHFTVNEVHTPFIPIDSGLQYLNNALRWVVLYGDPLIDYYLSVMAQLTNDVANSRSSKDRWKYIISRNIKEILANTPLPSVLQQAGFKFTSLSPSKDFKRLRSNPSLQESLDILIGAVVVIISLMKPAREIEITGLPRTCLLRSKQGHYWLDSDLAKRTKAERRARTGGKPIPVVTARAIQQIRKLNRGLTKLFAETDNYKRGKLFYLPNSNKWGAAMAINSKLLNKYLDLFCDYVALPPDEYGRRWYLRIHQMRKWFLLLLFWNGRYDVLDAARWIAGHTDVKHLYAYIEREFPGGKIGKLEAECAVDQLAEYDKTRVVMDGENVGLIELYQRVLHHFRVRSLSLVKEGEWKPLIEELFEDDYHLEPYTIINNTGNKRLCVAIRIGPREEL